MHLITSDEPVSSTVSRISFLLFTESLPPLPYTQVYAAKGANFLFEIITKSFFLKNVNCGFYALVKCSIVNSKKFVNSATKSNVFGTVKFRIRLY